jgi:hypothetical protein
MGSKRIKMEDLVPKHPTPIIEIEGADMAQDLNGKHMVIEPVKDFKKNPKPDSLDVASAKAARKAEKRLLKQKAAKQKVMEQRKAEKQLQLKQKVGAPAATKDDIPLPSPAALGATGMAVKSEPQLSKEAAIYFEKKETDELEYDKVLK